MVIRIRVTKFKMKIAVEFLMHLKICTFLIKSRNDCFSWCTASGHYAVGYSRQLLSLSLS